MNKAYSSQSVSSVRIGRLGNYYRQTKALVTGSILFAILLGVGTGVAVPFQSIISHAEAAQQAFVVIERSRGLPVRGQSSSKVQQTHGEPLSRKGAVGDPPISSWRYTDFTVYFEYDKVITSVADEDSLPATLGDIQ